jgi:hypothetical protein
LRTVATHLIPDKAGPYRIVTAMAGNPLVTNDKTGKKRVNIACRDHAQAEEVCRRLNEGEHNGSITVAGR